MKDKFHYLLFAACLAAVAIFVVLTINRDPTNFEVVLFQVVILVSGLLGSYIFGRKMEREGADDVIRIHARAAFRRVTALYVSLYRLSEKVEDLKRDGPDHRLNLIQALVDEHIRTGQDAMEDWRDIVPEEVDEIERRSARNDKSA